MVVRSIDENTLFYGDNLSILREYIPSESIDLIYLDPPFNSSRNYNVLFKDEHGAESEAQISAVTAIRLASIQCYKTCKILHYLNVLLYSIY